MRVPLSWLTDFAPLAGSPAELAGALSGLGLVVEGMETVGEGLGDVIVARVLATRPHPNADKVQVVDVDAGDGEALQIVCGAFNFSAGDVVPLAPVGARLPGGMQIGRRNVRGQWSNGMLCAGAELGLNSDGDGIMILDGGLAPGMPLTDALGIVADVVFDLDVTPNRPDALCVAGVARDLAAHFRVPFAIPEPPAVRGEDGLVTVVVESLDLCPEFTATVLTGVTIGPSPDWMARRLTLAGMRPINNIVDVSNYVMLELGQPNHPYDLDRLPGGGLLVRRAREGETLVTLDEVERVLQGDDCLICDAESTPVGIGGIMGGASSEIGAGTTTVALEAAWFDPLSISRTSKRLGLRTEASVRFERGVDPEGVHRAVARFCQLAAEVAGATVAGSTVDVRGELPRPPRVVVRTSRVNAILGTDLSPGEVSGYLQPIGFRCVPTGDGDFRVDIPSWRLDSDREIDVIEEVARHHGYTNIERTMPAIVQVGGLTPYQLDRRRAREILVGAGLSEAWATSFLAPEDLARAGLPTEAVEVENPLAAEESILRPSLLPTPATAGATWASSRSATSSWSRLAGSSCRWSPSSWPWPSASATPRTRSGSGAPSPTASAWPTSPWRRRPCRACTRRAAPGCWPGAGPSAPSARWTSRSWPPTGSRAGSGGWRSTSAPSWPRPAARPPTAGSAASRRPTSTWPSSSTTPCRRPPSSARCRAPRATCSSAWSSSTCSAAPSWRAPAAWPGGCGSPRSTTP
jgi:phenylalanyl-tRNA synthetase beta chain